MAASIVRIRTRADQIKGEQAERLRQMVMAFPGLPERATGEIVAAIDRQTAAENGWTFVMMSPEDNAKVVAWLFEHSTRPRVAVLLWSKLFMHLKRDTGEIVQTRDELADAVNVRPAEVSEIMTELESVGAISRKRVRIDGMRGPGAVRYFMSPRVGTHQTGAARDNAQAAAPLLRLVEEQG